MNTPVQITNFSRGHNTKHTIDIKCQESQLFHLPLYTRKKIRKAIFFDSFDILKENTDFKETMAQTEEQVIMEETIVDLNLGQSFPSGQKLRNCVICTKIGIK